MTIYQYYGNSQSAINLKHTVNLGSYGITRDTNIIEIYSGTKDNGFIIYMKQNIFRNEISNIPDGYTVIGDYLPNESYIQKDGYIYSYQ